MKGRVDKHDHPHLEGIKHKEKDRQFLSIICIQSQYPLFVILIFILKIKINNIFQWYSKFELCFKIRKMHPVLENPLFLNFFLVNFLGGVKQQNDSFLTVAMFFTISVFRRLFTNMNSFQRALSGHIYFLLVKCKHQTKAVGLISWLPLSHQLSWLHGKHPEMATSGLKIFSLAFSCQFYQPTFPCWLKTNWKRDI